MRALVFGGTGTVGSRLVEVLLARGATVRVLTRSPDKPLPPEAECALGDLDAPETLAPALEGVESVFLLTQNGPAEMHQGLTALAAILEAPALRRLVFLSVQGCWSAPQVPHFAAKIPITMAIRKAAREGGPAATILRVPNFFQNDEWLRDALLGAGIYPEPLGRVGVARVDVRDVAEAAATAMADLDGASREYAVSGPERFTGPEIAAVWSEALGRPIAYGGDDVEAWARAAAPYLPAWLLHDLKLMYRHVQRHGQAVDPAELERQQELLGRSPRRYLDYVAETAARWGAC